MSIGDFATTSKILESHGIHLKKSLGQNFLTSPVILEQIAEKVPCEERTGIIEIGPGVGALTEQLAKRAAMVHAIETDKRLLKVLSKTLQAYSNVNIIHGDVLKIDLSAICQEILQNCDRVSVAANLPYYITTPIIMRLLEENLPLHTIVVMVQAEVADRIQSPPGSKAYGVLSIAVQYYAHPEIVLDVSRQEFLPAPNVDSKVLRLTLRDKPPVTVNSKQAFFRTVKMSFAQRRKTLLNNLLHANPELGKESILRLLDNIAIDPQRRAETLSLEEFAILSNAWDEI